MPRHSGVMLDPLVVPIRGGDLRVRSLLITIFEDLIQPRGGEVGIMALQQIFEVLGLEAGAVRTAVSRLVADGWLSRRRDGRASFYRLDDAQILANRNDARRVYAKTGRIVGNNWMLIHNRDADADGSAARLLSAGFLSPTPDVFIWPLSRPIPTEILPEQAIVTRGILILNKDHREALCPVGTLEAYADLSEDITGLMMDLASVELTPRQAIAIRLMLIHRWQGILLSHPELSIEIEPDFWPGEQVRKQVAELYRKVLQQSEFWLEKYVPELGSTAWDDLPTRF